MTDWATVSSIATAGGTLVLALATYASVRSGNRASRTAERALAAGLRPVLFDSRDHDATQQVGWSDRRRVPLPGGKALIDVTNDDHMYMAISLRNVGSGIAVLHGWFVWPGWKDASDTAPPLDHFRRQTRDIYVPPGDIGFWHAAIREPDDPARKSLSSALDRQDRVSIDLLYGDLEGGQRTVSRFGLTRDDGTLWNAIVVRHWHIDNENPR
jgi:hypothetical protein